MCILFGFNTFVLQQRLQAAHQDWGRIVLDAAQPWVVAARRNHGANRGDRPRVRRGPNPPPISHTPERELGSVGRGEQSASTPSSSSLGGRMRLSQDGI